MYFESYQHAGRECCDGGLRENNPVQTAFNESREIWDANTPLDLILSIGSGKATKTQPRLSSTGVIPDWMKGLYETFMEAMNGETIWKDFLRNTASADKDVVIRARRLNVDLGHGPEPPLDAVERIDELQNLAHDYTFPVSYRSVVEPRPRNDLQEISLILKGSLFVFEITRRSKAEYGAITTLEGNICCRLQPGHDSLRLLLGHTLGFRIQAHQGGEIKPLTSASRTTTRPFSYPVFVQHETAAYSIPVTIEVCLHVESGEDYYVPISGFPCTIEVSSSNSSSSITAITR
jgi:hypothetical protein